MHLSVLVFVFVCVHLTVLPSSNIYFESLTAAQEAETNPLWAKKSGRAGQIPQKKSASSSCFLFFVNIYSKVYELSILKIALLQQSGHVCKVDMFCVY